MQARVCKAVLNVSLSVTSNISLDLCAPTLQTIIDRLACSNLLMATTKKLSYLIINGIDCHWGI